MLLDVEGKQNMLTGNTKSTPLNTLLQNTPPKEKSAPKKPAETNKEPGLVYNAAAYDQQFQAERAYAAYYQKMMQNQQQPKQEQQTKSYVKQQQEYDRTSHRDIIKTIMLSMMILFAISMHSLFDYWIKDVSSSLQLSFKQEIGIRILYPIGVFLFLWYLKISMR